MFRQGLARLFENDPDFHIAGQCESAAEGLAMLADCGATMVLLDVDLGTERAVDFVMDARKSGFTGPILVVTAGASAPEAVQLVQAGVAGILHKHHSAEVLAHTIRRVAAGEAYVEPEYVTPLFRAADRTRAAAQPTLTERDRTVLRFVFQGLTNKQIGAHLEISESAVKSSLRQLFEKLGVRTRAQLVRVSLEKYRDQL
jgi:two-component system, NarL family, nitrate/nitrite response regulator NarL